jgi:DNA-binding IclR family transcriptional regulator
MGLRMRANAGRRGPLHATASGKVLLAHAPASELLDRLLAAPLPPLTTTTITSPAVLRRELAEVRAQGYATCWQEREVGLCSAAVPLRDYTGTVVGSLAVAGPATRLTAGTLPAHLTPLQLMGRRIEAHLGGVRAPHDSEHMED